MKIINKHIIQANKNLKTIQKKSLTIREDYLKKEVQEAKIDGNKKNYRYLSNLILIEHQQQMHRRLNITLINVNPVASSTLKFQWTPPYLGTISLQTSLKISGKN